MEQQRQAARQSANEAEEQFQEALKAYRQAASKVNKPATTKAEQAAAEEAETSAERALALANAERAAARNRQLTWERMGPANEELIAGREEAAAANEAMRKQLAAGGEWNGPAYQRWADAVSRLTNAERNFNFARFGRPAGGPGPLPPSTQGQTQPIPKVPPPAQPSGEPASSPGAAKQPPAGACKDGEPYGETLPADALAQARRAAEDAQRQYKAARDAFEASNEAFFEAERKALASGQPVPDQTPEYRALLRAKIDALGRFDRMRTKFFEAGGKPSDLPPIDAVAGSGSMAGMAGAGTP